ncbi:MAG: thermonuclease family protein [Rhizobiales bacterium]|nr:thermonuclease family protein [Hyphomicrobiales bacterium]
MTERFWAYGGIAALLLVALGAGFSLFEPSVAQGAASCSLDSGERLRVREIVDGDTVVLADGRQVRLMGTQAPKLPLGRKGFPAWPLAPESSARLEKLSLGEMVTLKYGETRMDRHGRVLAHLFLDDGTWLQRQMVQEGMARVYTFSDNRQCADTLMEAEREARSARRGIWALPYYAIRDARDINQLNALEGTFQLVEGRVRDARIIKGRLYLNFGDDWRQDFTVTVPPAGVRLFDQEPWADLLGSSMPVIGRPLRVRGWIERYNGPQIVVDHPEQIELLNK